jgi:hypothetical protein
MKIYCINEKCEHHIKGYALCTALNSTKECPKNTKEKKENENKCKSNSNI